MLRKCRYGECESETCESCADYGYVERLNIPGDELGLGGERHGYFVEIRAEDSIVNVVFEELGGDNEVE